MTIIERNRVTVKTMKPSPSSPSLTSLSTPSSSLPSTPPLSSSPFESLLIGSRINGNGSVGGKPNWDIKPSSFAVNSINPIRQIVEGMKVEPNPNKKFIPLSIGDPTIFGNLTPCETIVNSLVSSIKSGKFNGYLASTGHEEARKSVAKYVSVPGAEIDSKDVFLASGCSHALDLCIALLGSQGKNILIPKPGFPLYKTLCHGYGIETRSYNLDPNRGWEVDLTHLESLIDSNTVAIVYNNPSNPCGSVFSESHLKAIVAVAEMNHVPIIADEIYEDMVFPGEKFIPIASVTTEVPVLSCRGTTKKFLIPGMRLGWITLHDRHERLGSSIRQALNQLCQRLLGPNGIIQGALPSILEQCPSQFFDDTISIIKENAEYAYNTLSRVRGLSPVKPAGAMYIMVGLDMRHFPSFQNDLKMMEKLVAEESVFALPGQCFDYPNFMRLVLTLPKELTAEACDRIANFCVRHYVEYPGSEEVPNVAFKSLNQKRDNSGIDTSMVHSLKT